MVPSQDDDAQLLLRLGKSLEMMLFFYFYMLLVGYMIAVETFDLINSSACQNGKPLNSIGV